MTTKTDTDKQLPTRCYTQSGNLLFKINIEICKKLYNTCRIESFRATFKVFRLTDFARNYKSNED